MKPIRPKSIKYQRSSVACTSCRQKRIKCDGAEPSCSSCLAKNIFCQYLHGENKRRPPSKKLVETLQLRIKILEDRLVALGQSIPAAVTESVQNDGLAGDAPNMEKLQADETEALLQQITEKTGSLAIDDDGELRYFSSVSNFNLVQKVASNIAERGKPEVRLSQVVTLPLELQEHLLELYFCWQNPWVYIVEKTVFMRDFYGDIATEHCTPLLLWAIYSVAARYSDRTCLRTDPEDPSTAGIEFAVHAKDLLRHECEITTISAVQAAALLSIQCMAENKEPAGWLYIGMATRMAFNIGLNIDCTNLVESGVISKEAANIRQVVWSGCWILDKLFVFGLGRSGTVANHYVTCPKLSTLDVAEFEPWATPADAQKHVRESFSRIPSTANYMSDHLSLAVSTLDIIYAPKSTLSTSEMHDLISKTDIEMKTCWSLLPSFLRLPTTSKKAALPHVYQLHMQYHVAQILLHRPFISNRKRSLGDTSSDPCRHMEICRASANEIITILRTYKHHYSLRFIVVGTVCHTFTAATIHLMDAVSDNPFTRRRGNSKLRVCVSALQEMGTLWTWSFRACRAIQLLAASWATHDLSLNGLEAETSQAGEGASQGNAQQPSNQFSPQEGSNVEFDNLQWLLTDQTFMNDMFGAETMSSLADLYDLDPWLAKDPKLI